MEQETTPIHQSLVRPVLLAGAERIVTIIWVGFCACIVATAIPAGIVSVRFGISALLTVAAWKIGMKFFRNMARADPQMFGIYWRHLNYRSFYPAQEKLRYDFKTQLLMMIGFK